MCEHVDRLNRALRSDPLQQALLERHARRHRWRDRLVFCGAVLLATAGYCAALFLITYTAAHVVRWLSN